MVSIFKTNPNLYQSQFIPIPIYTNPKWCCSLIAGIQVNRHFTQVFCRSAAKPHPLFSTGSSISRPQRISAAPTKHFEWKEAIYVAFGILWCHTRPRSTSLSGMLHSFPIYSLKACSLYVSRLSWRLLAEILLQS